MNSKSLIKFTFVLFVLYYALTIFVPHDRYGEVQAASRIFPQITMAIISILGIIFVFAKRERVQLFLAFYIITIMSWLYVLYSSATPIETVSFILKQTCGYVFTIVFFYFLILDDKRTVNWFIILFFVILVYGMITHFTKVEENRFGETESGAGFIFSQLIPFTLVFTNKKWSPYAFITCVVMCLLSGQRTAALIAALYCILAFFLYQKHLKMGRLIMVVLVVAVIAWPFITDGVDNLLVRHSRDLEGDSYGSGRSFFWSLALKRYSESSIFEYIFGLGLFSNKDFFENAIGHRIGAHSEWVDTLFQFGIIGLIIFASGLVSVFRKVRRIKKAIPQYGWVLLFMGLSWVLKSTVSHGFLDINSIPFCMTLAYIYFSFEKKRKQELSLYFRRSGVSYGEVQ